MTILQNWILQSESWHKFKQFRLSQENMSNYVFLNQYDDFYISLVNRLDNILDNYVPNISKNNIIQIAKGLEIYGLEETKNTFMAISEFKSLLYASALYYLGEKTAISNVLAKFLVGTENISDIDEFLIYFLSRNHCESQNQYIELLNSFLYSGDSHYLHQLIKLLEKQKEHCTPTDFLSIKIALNLITVFCNDNIWNDLGHIHTDTNFLFWRKYITNLIHQKMWNFFPSQKLALNKGLLTSNKTISLQMPTSAGKTAICEMLIISEFTKNSNVKILFLAPFRSLASELKNKMCKHLKNMGIKCKVTYGGNEPTQQDAEDIYDANLLVATPEMLISYENLDSNIYNQYNLVICDEGHLIGDETRGLYYELLLSKLKKINNIRFVFLSAILPNIQTIHAWLSNDSMSQNIIESDYRPTNITYCFLIEAGRKTFNLKVTNESNTYYLNKFISDKDITYKNEKTHRFNTYTLSSFIKKSTLVGFKSLQAGTVAIFCAQRSEVEDIVKTSIEITETLQITSPIYFANIAKICDLCNYLRIITGSESLLFKAAQKGILFHHGHLPQFIRELVEEYLRNQWIKYFACTNTIAEGVNFPIKTLVVNSCRRYNHICNHRAPLKIRDLKNLFGRTGRAGQETEGIVITINPCDFIIVNNVINNRTEAASSYLLLLISSLETFLKQHALNFNNEWLESQTSISELIDKIDLSIISMLPNNIETDNLESILKELELCSLTYFMTTQEQKELFHALLIYRMQRIKDYIIKNEFTYLKSSQLGVCKYEKLLKIISFDDDFWTNNQISLDEIINKFLSWKGQIDTTNYNHYFLIIHNWINGKWYHQLSKEYNVNEIFDIFADFVSSFTSFCQSVISIALTYLNQYNILISPNIENFAQFLEKGVSNTLQIHLYEIGFTERLGNYAIYKTISSFENYEYENNYQLKNFIKNNRQLILDILSKNDIPKLAIDKIENNIHFL